MGGLRSGLIGERFNVLETCIHMYLYDVIRNYFGFGYISFLFMDLFFSICGVKREKV